MNLARTIGENLAGAIEAHDFGAILSAQFATVPVFDRAASGTTVYVQIVPSNTEYRRATRAETGRSLTYQAIIRRNLTDETTIDDMMDTTEAIARFVLWLRLSSPSAVCRSIDNMPMYDHEDARQKRVFTSVLSITMEAVQ